MCRILAASKFLHCTCRINGSNLRVVVAFAVAPKEHSSVSFSVRHFRISLEQTFSWEHISQRHPFFLFLFLVSYKSENILKNYCFIRSGTYVSVRQTRQIHTLPTFMTYLFWFEKNYSSRAAAKRKIVFVGIELVKKIIY